MMAVSSSTAINLMASFNWNGRNNSYVNYYKPIKKFIEKTKHNALLKHNHIYQYHNQHLIHTNEWLYLYCFRISKTPVYSFDYTPVDISSVTGLKYLNNSLVQRLQDQYCVRMQKHYLDIR
jgi:hypothetical protein